MAVLGLAQCPEQPVGSPAWPGPPRACPLPLEASGHCHGPPSAPLPVASCLEAQWAVSVGPLGTCLQGETVRATRAQEQAHSAQLQ